VSGGWKINQGAALRAVVLDPAPGSAKAAPPVVTLAKADVWGAIDTVCQGFPVVAADAGDLARGWISWLEADPNASSESAACLWGGSQGGVLRLARLDAAGAAVAGETCSASGTDGPLALTGGFAVRGSGPGGLPDPLSSPILSIRPQGTSLNKFSASLTLTSSTLDAQSETTISASAGVFSLVHPVTVDLVTPLTDGTRFWSFGLTEKVSGATTTRQLWALPVDNAGVDMAPAVWLTGTTVSGGGSGDLHDITAVCAMDAAVSASGEVGVAMVVRRGGNDQILLARRTQLGAAVVDLIKEKSPSKGDCRFGLASVRLVSVGGDWIAAYFEGIGVPPMQGAVGYAKFDGATASSTAIDVLSPATLDSNGGSSPTNSLAWRGLGGFVADASGAVSLVVETQDNLGNREISMHTFKP